MDVKLSGDNMQKMIIGFFFSSDYAEELGEIYNRTENSDYELQMIRYSDPVDLLLKWKKYLMIIQGGLVDCESAYLHITQNFGRNSVPIAKVEPVESDVLKYLLSFDQNVPALHYNRILIDAGHYKDFESVLPIENRPVFFGSQEWAEPPAAEWESQMIRRYQTAFESACYDILLTKHAKLMNRLEALGIPARAIYPSKSTFLLILKLLILEVHQKTKWNYIPAYGIIGIRGGTLAAEKLYRSIENFNREHEGLILLTRRSGVCELGLSNEFLCQLTNTYTRCILTEHLKTIFTDDVCTGWGIGYSLVAARSNAIRAYRESLFDRGHQSYLVNHNGSLVGPLIGKTLPHHTDESRRMNIEKASVQAGMSVKTLQKMSEKLDLIGRNAVTSEALSKSMGITQRSAARILARLAEFSLAVPVEVPNKSQTGRPKKHYTVFL
jgi:hypothetical protein